MTYYSRREPEDDTPTYEQVVGALQTIVKWGRSDEGEALIQEAIEKVWPETKTRFGSWVGGVIDIMEAAKNLLKARREVRL